MGMRIDTLVNILNAKVLTPELDLQREVEFAFTSDLMSDVLTGDHESTVLITGLSNLQAIRTAEMSDIGEVIVGRNKVVSEEMIELARENGIILLSCAYSLFRISGILYEKGVKALF